MRVQNIDFKLSALFETPFFDILFKAVSNTLAGLRDLLSHKLWPITYFQPCSLLVVDSIIGIKQGVAVVFLVVPNVQHVLVEPGVACASKQ